MHLYYYCVGKYLWVAIISLNILWYHIYELYEYIIAVPVHFIERKYKMKTILIDDVCFCASYVIYIILFPSVKCSKIFVKTYSRKYFFIWVHYKIKKQIK